VDRFNRSDWQESREDNFRDEIALSRNPADEPKNFETKPKLTFKCGCKQLKKSYEEKRPNHKCLTPVSLSSHLSNEFVATMQQRSAIDLAQ
jgi:hypothetical protein